MTGLCFLDTGILLHSIGRDAARRTQAVELIESGEVALSTQVLAEFYEQARVTHADAIGLIEAWCRFPVQAITLEVLRIALEFRRLPMRDRTVIAAAKALGCSCVYSDQIQPQSIDGLVVINPF